MNMTYKPDIWVREKAKCRECEHEWRFDPHEVERPIKCPNCYHVYHRYSEMSPWQKTMKQKEFAERMKEREPTSTFSEKERQKIYDWIGKGTKVSDVLIVPLSEEDKALKKRLEEVLYYHRERGVYTEEHECPSCGSQRIGSTLMPKDSWNRCNCEECGARFHSIYHKHEKLWESTLV